MTGGPKMEKTNLIPMNLQFFAEETTLAADDLSNAKEEEKNKETKEEDEKNKTKETEEGKTIEELLTDEKFKAEFDSKIASAVKAAKAELQREAEEAKKLSEMTEKEKTDYELKKREKEIVKKEAEITRRELRLEAVNRLKSANVPEDLVELVNFTNADTCTESANLISEKFKEAVQAAVEEKLVGNTVIKKAESSIEKQDIESIVKKAIRG